MLIYEIIIVLRKVLQPSVDLLKIRSIHYPAHLIHITKSWSFKISDQAAAKYKRSEASWAKSPFLLPIQHSMQIAKLKVAFFPKVWGIFQISKSQKTNIPNHYPELEI